MLSILATISRSHCARTEGRHFYWLFVAFDIGHHIAITLCPYGRSTFQLVICFSREIISRPWLQISVLRHVAILHLDDFQKRKRESVYFFCVPRRSCRSPSVSSSVCLGFSTWHVSNTCVFHLLLSLYKETVNEIKLFGDFVF